MLILKYVPSVFWGSRIFLCLAVILFVILSLALYLSLHKIYLSAWVLTITFFLVTNIQTSTNSTRWFLLLSLSDVLIEFILGWCAKFLFKNSSISMEPCHIPTPIQTPNKNIFKLYISIPKNEFKSEVFHSSMITHNISLCLWMVNFTCIS